MVTGTAPFLAIEANILANAAIPPAKAVTATVVKAILPKGEPANFSATVATFSKRPPTGPATIEAKVSLNYSPALVNLSWTSA